MNDAAKPKIRKPKLVHPHKQVGSLQTEIRAWVRETEAKMYQKYSRTYESTQELFRYGVIWNAKVFCRDRNLNALPSSISRALKTLEVRGLIRVRRLTATEKRITHIKIILTPDEQKIENEKIAAQQRNRNPLQRLPDLKQLKSAS
jgi:hypothetical protein